ARSPWSEIFGSASRSGAPIGEAGTTHGGKPMALLGTLAEFHVDDILVLLAGTKKTGVLAVEGGRKAARLWVDSGHIVGSELPGTDDASEAVFELLRLVEGKFAFEAGAVPTTLGAPQDVKTVLVQARTKLAEWRDIE